jgi:hypothetical protein
VPIRGLATPSFAADSTSREQVKRCLVGFRGAFPGDSVDFGPCRPKKEGGAKKKQRKKEKEKQKGAVRGGRVEEGSGFEEAVQSSSPNLAYAYVVRHPCLAVSEREPHFGIHVT